MNGANEPKAVTLSGDGEHLRADLVIETCSFDAPPIVPAAPELPLAYANLGAEGSLTEPLPASNQAQWPEILLGDVVVAKERPGLEIWHEADVLRVSGDVLTLKWSGLPDSETIQRRTWQVAVLRRPLHRTGGAQ